MERMDSFVILGSKMDMKTGCRDEIKRRLALGRAAMNGLDKLWRDGDTTKATKQSLMKALVFHIATVGMDKKKVRTCQDIRF